MRQLIILAAALALTACATAPTPYVPVVDRPGPNYAADLADCQALAQQRDPVKSAVGGTVAGAVLGGMLGAAIGGRGGAAFGAKVGAGEGLIGGAASGIVQQRVIVMSCLVGRGYRPLA